MPYPRTDLGISDHETSYPDVGYLTLFFLSLVKHRISGKAVPFWGNGSAIDQYDEQS